MHVEGQQSCSHLQTRHHMTDHRLFMIYCSQQDVGNFSSHIKLIHNPWCKMWRSCQGPEMHTFVLFCFLYSP